MRKLTLVSLFLTLTLTACGGRELTNVTLIQTLGVDGGREIALTAVGDEEERPAIYQTRGKTVIEAQAALQELGTTRLEVTHVAQLVLGSTADVAETLWQEMLHRDSGYGATVWLCAGDAPAGELLQKAKDPARRLKALEENGGAQAPTILEALSDLARTGQTVLPLVALEGEELHLAGYAAVTGTVTGEEG